jgi:hypothetical protein
VQFFILWYLSIIGHHRLTVAIKVRSSATTPDHRSLLRSFSELAFETGNQRCAVLCLIGRPAAKACFVEVL